VESAWPCGVSLVAITKAERNVASLRGLDRKGMEKLLGKCEKQVHFDPFLVEQREHRINESNSGEVLASKSRGSGKEGDKPTGRRTQSPRFCL